MAFNKKYNNPIKLIMTLSDQLTVVITTHILPTAPSTHIIEECINSIKKQFKGINKCKFLVFCDVKNIEEWASKEYISNLNKINGIDLNIEINSGLKQNYIKAIENINTPFMLFCEHDWAFLRKINTLNIINTMLNNNFVNFIRFNKRDNDKAHINNPEPGDKDFWETYIEEELETSQPLVKTNCFATHPHIIRVSKFVKEWKSLLKTFSIEWDIHEAYNKEIDKKKFKNIHKNWGIYNYGSLKDKKIVTHLDGSNSGRT